MAVEVELRLVRRGRLALLIASAMLFPIGRALFYRG